MLRCATWLAPGLPLGLFELLSGEIARALGSDVAVESFTASSGPDPDDDPFARDEFDIGFMCTPSYRQLSARTPASVQLVPAAAVFIDERNQGRPVYFVELVGRGGFAAETLPDLVGARVGFNDERSLSGRLALEGQLRERGVDESALTLVPTGGHHQSLALLESGELDAASIDSNTLLANGGLPDGLHIIETWGPFPIQPVVARASLLGTTCEIIASALLALDGDPDTARALRRFRVERFAPVTDADYR